MDRFNDDGRIPLFLIHEMLPNMALFFRLSALCFRVSMVLRLDFLAMIICSLWTAAL